jgi:hypothetical protein
VSLLAECRALFEPKLVEVDELVIGAKALDLLVAKPIQRFFHITFRAIKAVQYRV